jgi:hypothetical protein
VALAQSINIGSAQGNQGAQVTIPVSLSAGTAQIAGTQNDVAFEAAAKIAPKDPGKCSLQKPTKVCTTDADCTAVANDFCAKAPDCSVNPAISKGGTAFSFRPPGCSYEQGSCTGIRALVLALDNADPIPDGSDLYTCVVNIAADAANGDYALTASGVVLSDPDGGSVTPADPPAQNGKVTVGGGGGEPTPTPTIPAAVCDAPAVQAGTVQATPGTQVTVGVTLKAGTAQVAGTQNDLVFDAKAKVVAKDPGKCSLQKPTKVCTTDADCTAVAEDFCAKAPDCSVNPEINKGGTAFSFRPTGCSYEKGTCTGIRALVLALDNADPIADGATLYTCNVSVASDADSTYPLSMSGVILSDPDGGAVPNASACSGAVVAGGEVEPTATPTEGEEEPTPTATATPPPVPTNTAPAVATSTPTTKPPATNTPGGGVADWDDDDGCQIATRSNGSVAWMLLIPAVGLLVLRRRSR